MKTPEAGPLHNRLSFPDDMLYVETMPKDFIHFAVAGRTASLLADTPFGNDAHQHDASLLLGSVFHDVWFYMTGRSSGRLKELGDQLHGKDGQDTFMLLREQARVARESVRQGNGGTARALLVGMASHLCADVTMHPMVYYFSGNYYEDKKAVERHRRLESLLDLAADSVEKQLKSTQIRHMLKAVDLKGAYPARPLAKLAEVSEETLHKELGEAFAIFAALQQHLQKSSQARLAFLLRRIMPQTVRDFLALFYSPQLKKHLPLVRGTLSYRHPVTGETLEDTLEQLMAQSAKKAASLLRSMQDYVYGEGELDLPTPGPSLDTGLPGQGTDKAVHFSPTPLPNI